MKMRKATATPEEWARYLESSRLWRLANLERERAKRRAYSKLEHVKEDRRRRDMSPERIAKRREYAKTADAKKRGKEIYQTRLANDPEFRQKRNALTRKLRTGFDHALVLALVEAQGNRCAICAVSFTERRMVADHCHATGKPRGLLCHHCNIIDGMLTHVGIDPVEFAHKLVSYLRKPLGSHDLGLGV